MLGGIGPAEVGGHTVRRKKVIKCRTWELTCGICIELSRRYAANRKSTAKTPDVRC